MKKKTKRELITAIVFLLGTILTYVGYMYSLYAMDSDKATLIWVNPGRVVSYILYATIFFVLPYEKFNDLLEKQRNTNNDKRLVYALFSNSKLRAVTLLVLASVIVVIMEEFVYLRMFITFSLELWKVKYAIVMLGIICISAWTVWEIKEQYKSFVVAHIAFALLSIVAYIFTYDEFLFSVMVMLGGSMAWNITYAVYNKKISFTNIVLTTICLVSTFCTFVIFAGRVTELENVFSPERDPCNGGWELLQLRKYWSGEGFEFEADYLEYNFMENHPLLLILKYGRGVGFLVFVGVALVLGAFLYFVYLHQGKKRYVIISIMSYFMVLVGVVTVSGLGMIPCIEARIPFSGVTMARDTIMLGVALRCMVPYSLVKWKKNKSVLRY